MCWGCSNSLTGKLNTCFRCVKYMNTYSSCLMQGYGVLPSPPTKLRVSNIETNFAILHWGKPKTLGDTVSHYTLHYRFLQDQDYTITAKVQLSTVCQTLWILHYHICIWYHLFWYLYLKISVWDTLQTKTMCLRKYAVIL